MGKEEQLKDKLEGYSRLNIFLSPFLFLSLEILKEEQPTVAG